METLNNKKCKLKETGLKVQSANPLHFISSDHFDFNMIIVIIMIIIKLIIGTIVMVFITVLFWCNVRMKIAVTVVRNQRRGLHFAVRIIVFSKIFMYAVFMYFLPFFKIYFPQLSNTFVFLYEINERKKEKKTIVLFN